MKSLKRIDFVFGLQLIFYLLSVWRDLCIAGSRDISIKNTLYQ